MSFDTDVLILGAGPVGLTLANELARRGVTPRIVDKEASIREVSKAMILHVRTQEVLQRVGIAEQARAVAQPLTEVVVHAYGKHIGSWDLDRIDSPFPHPIIIGQNRTQHLLEDALAERGCQVERNCEALALDVRSDAAVTTLRHTDPATGEKRDCEVSSKYVVGCEGSNSLVRRTLGLSFEGDRYTGEQFIQADCRIRWALPKGRSYLFLTSAGYLMVIEFPNEVVRVFISLPDANSAAQGSAPTDQGAVEAINEVPTLEEIRLNLERLSGYPCELSDPIWLARYRTSHRYANKFSAGRSFVVGDAAHVHVPIGGQGMNTGIQDAFNLGWKLAGVVKGELRESVLDTYNAERHPVAEALIRGTDFAYTGILHPSELKQRAVRWFGPFVIGQPRVRAFMRDTLEELKIDYPASPLNLDLHGATGPAPGERVLDAPLVRASDLASLHLSEVSNHGGWTLLVFGGRAGAVERLNPLLTKAAARFGARLTPFAIIASAVAPPMSIPAEHVLLDALGLAHERYGVSEPALYLLRPDTYVGARGPIDRQDALIEHLAKIFA